MKISDEYAHGAPTPQAAIDILKGSWLSRLPIEGTSAGEVDAFHDPRIAWAQEQLGFGDRRVLELGPLEGGHSYQMERLGAREIVAIEGSPRAFLKCLIVKELLGLKTQFLFGDITAYLEQEHKFDLILASGVLYHMTQPLQMLSLCARNAPRLFLWTHFYDPEIMGGTSFVRAEAPLISDGYQCPSYSQTYKKRLAKLTFSGGSAAHSVWLRRDDILGFLRHLGFETTIAFEQRDHPSGPAFAVAARRDV